MESGVENLFSATALRYISGEPFPGKVKKGVGGCLVLNPGSKVKKFLNLPDGIKDKKISPSMGKVREGELDLSD